MITISFTVPAVPVAQPRDRAVRFGNSARVHPVTTIKNARTGKSKPHPIAAFKATVRMVAAELYTGPPLQGPLRVDSIFVFPRPQNKIWKTRPMPRYRHEIKPDRDNCDKSVLDALSGLLWVDDAQVCDGRLQKWVASGYEQPHVEIRVTQLESVEPEQPSNWVQPPADAEQLVLDSEKVKPW